MRFLVFSILLLFSQSAFAQGLDFYFRQLERKTTELVDQINTESKTKKDDKKEGKIDEEILTLSGNLLAQVQKKPTKDLEVSPLEIPVQNLHESLALALRSKGKNKIKYEQEAKSWQNYVGRFPLLQIVMAYRRAGLGHEEMLNGKVQRAEDHFLVVQELLDGAKKNFTPDELKSLEVVNAALEYIFSFTRREVVMKPSESNKALKNLRNGLIALCRNAEKNVMKKGKKF